MLTQDWFVLIHFSSGRGRVVSGPHHGPRVDVEQGTARAWLALTIARAQFIARVLAAVHASGDGARLGSEEVYPECERGEQHTPQALGMAGT